MLSSIRVENFKSFRDTTQIDLAPLTFLAGVNSAGKSSIIQALLLLKQTLESGPAIALNFGSSIYLQQSLGDAFNDFIHNCPPIQDSSLTYHLGFKYNQQKIIDPGMSDLFDDVKALLPAALHSMSNQDLLADIHVTFAWGPFGSRGRPTVRMADLQITVRLSNDDQIKPLIGVQIRPSGSGKYQTMPILSAMHDGLKNLDFQQVRLDGLSNFLPLSIFIAPTQPSLFEQSVPPAFVSLLRSLTNLMRQDLSERLFYLSSFRSSPKSNYPGSATYLNGVDPDGQNFADILWKLRDEPVRFDHPRLITPELPLRDMTTWVLEEILNLKQHISVKPVGEREDNFEVLVETMGPPREDGNRLQVRLPSVGLGYNQLLPVVVQGLLTPQDALVIYEQPEIHLHAEIQARLVTFLIGLARSGRKVLVETHSTHMVDQVCLEIAKDRSSKANGEPALEDQTNVLFVHPPNDTNDSSRIEPVRIDAFGVIQNYPEHFLPDVVGIYETIIEEGFRKRKDQTRQDQ